jgi:hypothetical protein
VFPIGVIDRAPFIKDRASARLIRFRLLIPARQSVACVSARSKLSATQRILYLDALQALIDLPGYYDR